MKNEYGIKERHFSEIEVNRIKLHETLNGEIKDKLQRFFKLYKEKILKYHQEVLSFYPKTLYKNFILNSIEGQNRIQIYMDLFEAALSGKIELFFEDQKKIGYTRATEGYHLNDVYGYTVSFKDALWKAIEEYNSESKHGEKLKNKEMFFLNRLLDYAYYFLSLSFIETRDELISKHRNQLQSLQQFAAGVVSIFEEEKIWALTIQGVYDIYKLNGTVVLIDHKKLDDTNCNTVRMIGIQIAQKELNRIKVDICKTHDSLGIDKFNKIVALSKSFNANKFRYIASPILERRSILKGFICLHDQGREFNFSKFDQDLLYQFSCFTSAVSTNSRMVSEIASKEKDLKSLTKNLISVQEKERKKIAADIHDGVTQALSGIGYKALYCMEIAEKNPQTLQKELKKLTDIINESLRQSRQIISNLRPHILDNFGLIAASKKLIKEFQANFGIVVKFISSESIKINPETGIALFRILQEALYNVRRHSSATFVEVSLETKKEKILIMKIEDNGCGFNPIIKQQYKNNLGIGLLTMKERSEDLNGKFLIESKPGNGCKIIVIIPIQGEINYNEK